MDRSEYYPASSLLEHSLGLVRRDQDPDLNQVSIDFSNGLSSVKIDRRSAEHRLASAFRAWVLDALPLPSNPVKLTFSAVHELAQRRSRSSAIEAGDLIALRLAHEPWGPDAIGALRTRLDENAWAYLRKRLRLLDVDLDPDEVLATYTADTVHARHHDLIGGVEREAMAFARVCAATQIDPPLAIGVFGQWGTGKSYFMEKVHGSVAALSQASNDRAEAGDDPSQSLFHTHIVQIRFNAWHYIETNLWASLVEHIFAELDNWLRSQAKPASGDKDEVDNLFERLSTSRLLKLEAVDELVASRERQQRAAAAVERERHEYRKALEAQQARRETEFPWPAVMAALRSNEARQAAYSEAGDKLGFAQLSDSGDKLARIYEQSIDAGGRALLMYNTLSSRFGRTWWLFVLIVVAVTALPWVIVHHSAEWDTVGAAISSFCLVVATIGGMVGHGLRTASKAISTLETYRKDFDDAVKDQQKLLREELSAAEDHLAKVEADVGRAEEHLTEAERLAKQAAADFNAGTARGRLNRFIRDKVTKGDYARHLGLVTSIRRDFVELARLMREAGADDTRYDLEAKKFEDDYRRRVEDTIARSAARYCAQVESLMPAAEDDEPAGAEQDQMLAKAKDYKAHVEGLLGGPLPAVIELASEDEFASRPNKPEPTLSKAEIDRLWAGLDEPAKTKAAAFDRIILYIDDLDRCPPDKVVKVLQAAHLLLGFRLFVVLIAVDERWVSRALTHHYDQMLADPGREDCEPGAASSHDYLEKIFQLPYWVRPMSDEASTTFVAGLLERDAQAARAPAPKTTEPASEAPSTTSTGADPSATEASDQPAQGSGQPTLEPHTPELEVEAMLLTQAEREFMVALANVDSPRRGKRFVNAYRLIKASLPPHRLATFVREGQSEAYRAVLVQLGIATGAPTVATAYFERLHDPERTEDGLAELIAWAQTRRPRDPDDRDRLVSMLRVAEGKVAVTTLREWTTIARRYSFVPQLT